MILQTVQLPRPRVARAAVGPAQGLPRSQLAPAQLGRNDMTTRRLLTTLLLTLALLGSGCALESLSG